MDKIRRSPEAWIKSCEMDTSRKLLIVEGIEDRLFIEYITSDEINSNSIILEIDSIEIDKSLQNGNNGRVLFFASLIKNKISNIKCFVDKDYQFLKKTKLPDCVIPTDFRDLEGYLYEIHCMTKFLKLGLKTEKIAPKKLLTEIFGMRFFGLLRIISIEHKLDLSINITNLKMSKYLEIGKDFSVTILEEKYIESVLQNSNYTIKKDKLTDLITEAITKYKNVQDRDVLHGKDVLSLVKEIAGKLGLKKDNVENVFWMSFDKTQLPNYKNLNGLVTFLK